MIPPRRAWFLLAAAACLAADRDAVEVLARFGETARQNAARLSGCACVETINRSYYRANIAAARDCDELAAAKRKRGYKLTLESTDRVRVEVRDGGGAEAYSWPGEDRFDGRDPWDIIGYGPANSGAFAMNLREVVQGDAADFALQGQTENGGRKLYQYTFRVPEERSHWEIKIGGQFVVTSWDGTLLIDPETSELVRMTTRSSELPREAFSCEIDTAADYGKTAEDAGGVPVARETHQRYIDRTGAETESVIHVLRLPRIGAATDIFRPAHRSGHSARRVRGPAAPGSARRFATGDRADHGHR